MRKVLLITAILGLTAILVGATFVDARGNRRGHGFGKHMGFNLPYRFIEENAETLGVTDDQLAKLKDLSTKCEKESIVRRADKKVLQLDLRNLLESDRPDRKKIASLVNKINGMDTDLKLLKINTFLDMKEVLSPEQIDKIKKLIREKREQRRANRPHRRGNRDGGYGPPPGGPGNGPYGPPQGNTY